jgi:hypothetical protein
VLIEVKPFERKWAVYIDGEIFGVSKHSFDADFAAERVAVLFEPLPEVKHYAEDRQRLMAEMKGKPKG